jgi:hypothetical protein
MRRDRTLGKTERQSPSRNCTRGFAVQDLLLTDDWRRVPLSAETSELLGPPAPTFVLSCVYPVDLGSYLVANVNNAQLPSASAAVRLGGAVTSGRRLIR